MTAALPGPLDLAPDITPGMAAAMLDSMLTDLPWGIWDQRVRELIENFDPAAEAAIASWLHRSRVRGFSEAAELIEQRASEL